MIHVLLDRFGVSPFHPMTLMLRLQETAPWRLSSKQQASKKPTSAFAFDNLSQDSEQLTRGVRLAAFAVALGGAHEGA